MNVTKKICQHCVGVVNNCVTATLSRLDVRNNNFKITNGSDASNFKNIIYIIQ